MSWDEAFAERYEEWSAPMTADVPFYVGLAREADGPLVELAVGNGRVAIPVAQATGGRVTGIDALSALLENARLYGGFAGEPHDGQSGEYVFVPTRRYSPSRSRISRDWRRATSSSVRAATASATRKRSGDARRTAATLARLTMYERWMRAK